MQNQPPPGFRFNLGYTDTELRSFSGNSYPEITGSQRTYNKVHDPMLDGIEAMLKGLNRPNPPSSTSAVNFDNLEAMLKSPTINPTPTRNNLIAQPESASGGAGARAFKKTAERVLVGARARVVYLCKRTKYVLEKGVYVTLKAAHKKAVAKPKKALR